MSMCVRDFQLMEATPHRSVMNLEWLEPALEAAAQHNHLPHGISSSKEWHKQLLIVHKQRATIVHNRAQNPSYAQAAEYSIGTYTLPDHFECALVAFERANLVTWEQDPEGRLYEDAVRFLSEGLLEHCWWPKYLPRYRRIFPATVLFEMWLRIAEPFVTEQVPLSEPIFHALSNIEGHMGRDIFTGKAELLRKQVAGVLVSLGLDNGWTRNKRLYACALGVPRYYVDNKHLKELDEVLLQLRPEDKLSDEQSKTLSIVEAIAMPDTEKFVRTSSIQMLFETVKEMYRQRPKRSFEGFLRDLVADVEGMAVGLDDHDEIDTEWDADVPDNTGANALVLV